LNAWGNWLLDDPNPSARDNSPNTRPLNQNEKDTNMSTTNDRTWACDAHSDGSKQAMEEGQHEALAEIKSRIEALKSATLDVSPMPVMLKAKGALRIWHAAANAADQVISEWDGKIPNIDIVCAHCGSHDVKRDAWAGWNTAAQAWELLGVLDDACCEECGDWVSLNEVPCK
jgi:hypothetical protein